MLPNKSSNGGVIKSATVLLYGKWNMCFGFGVLFGVGVFFVWKGWKKGNGMGWGPIQREKVGVEGL